MMDFLRDLRLGFRLLLRAPGFAVTAILTLALGIGATTALFTVVNAVLLDPLPFPGRRARFARRAGHGAQKRMTKNEEQTFISLFVLYSSLFAMKPCRERSRLLLTEAHDMSAAITVTTTPSIEGKKITSYKGVVTGEAIMGANIFKDVFAGIRDIVGGRSATYERELRRARDLAMDEIKTAASEMGANAVVAIDIDYETVGGNGSMLMVTVSGTAVVLQ